MHVKGELVQCLLVSFAFLQDPELRKKFEGKPEHVVNYLFMLAEDVSNVPLKHVFVLKSTQYHDLNRSRDYISKVKGQMTFFFSPIYMEICLNLGCGKAGGHLLFWFSRI